MKIFANDTEKARAEVERLGAARERLAQRLADVSDELEALRSGAGARELAEVLEQADGSEARNRLLLLDTQIHGMRAARGELVTRLVDAYRALNVAEATEKRQQADKAERELLQHCAQRDKLLKALEDFESCKWCPLIRAQQAEVEAVPAGALVVGGVVLDGGIPKAERMAAEVRQLRQLADSIERRPVRVDGAAEGQTVEQVHEAMKIPNAILPLASEVRNWAANAEAAALKAWRESLRGPEPPYGLRFGLLWRHGVIVEGKSFCRVELLHPEALQVAEQARLGVEAKAGAAA